jgi:actin
MTCPELLFKPELNGKTCPALHELAWGSIMSSDIDIRRDLLKNVILSGGTTMFEGLSDRLKNEVIALNPAGAEIKVHANHDRKFAVWRGGSLLTSLSTFQTDWIG